MRTEKRNQRPIGAPIFRVQAFHSKTPPLKGGKDGAPKVQLQSPGHPSWSKSSLLDYEGWPNKLHPVRRKHLRVLLQGWLLCDFLEVGFHLPGRLKRHEHPACFVSDMCPHVRHHSWCEKRVAWFQPRHFGPNFEEVLPVQDMEPFLLFMMQMTGRTALAHIRRLKNKKPTVSILSSNFESKGIGADIPNLLESVRTAWYYH
jgi:hypothetical protein